MKCICHSSFDIGEHTENNDIFIEYEHYFVKISVIFYNNWISHLIINIGDIFNKSHVANIIYDEYSTPQTMKITPKIENDIIKINILSSLMLLKNNSMLKYFYDNYCTNLFDKNITYKTIEKVTQYY